MFTTGESPWVSTWHQDASPSFYTKPIHVYAATLRRNFPNPLVTKALSDTLQCWSRYPSLISTRMQHVGEVSLIVLPEASPADSEKCMLL
jgi:hypothetical protein